MIKKAANALRRFGVRRKAATRTVAFLQSVVRPEKGKLWPEKGRIE